MSEDEAPQVNEQSQTWRPLRYSKVTGISRELDELRRAIFADGHRSVHALGERTAGGAYGEYLITTPARPAGFDKSDGPQLLEQAERISFQHDVIPKVGVVGATNKCLLAIVADRLRAFQASPFACEHKAKALECVEKALIVLENRTRERRARGVEGTHTP